MYLNNIFPLGEYFRNIYSLNLEKQEARVYTGIEGLKTIYNEILEELKNGEEYLAFVIKSKQVAEKYKRYFDDVWKSSKKST